MVTRVFGGPITDVDVIRSLFNVSRCFALKLTHYHTCIPDFLYSEDQAVITEVNVLFLIEEVFNNLHLSPSSI